MTIQTHTPQITIVTNIIKITKMIDTEILIDIVAIVENIRKTTIDQILDKDITIDLEVHIDLDLINIIKEELHLDLHIDLHIEITQITDITLAQDTDLVPNHKETPSNDIIIHIDLHQNLEILNHDLEHPHETDNKTLITFSTFTEKDYPYIFYIYTIKCKKPIHFKPRSGKTIHFPIENYSNLHFELEDNTKFYPTNPYTYFLQKFKDIFHFLDMIVNEKSKDYCATIIQNFTS